MSRRRLRAEVERWREKAQEAGAAYANANTKHHSELDRANRLEGMAERLAEHAVDLEDRARTAEAEVERQARLLRGLESEASARDAAEAKVAELEAEVERLRASPWDVTHRECDRLVARRWREDRDALRAAEAERDRLAEKVARVEALRDNWLSQKSTPEVAAWTRYVSERINNALDGDYSGETEDGGE